MASNTGSGIADNANGVMFRYKSLRDALADIAKHPVQTLRSALAKTPMDEVNSFWALNDVNFEIKKGEVVGIIGRNGAGKSTLLKVLSRITKPTIGRVDLFGRVGSLLEVGTGFHPELSGRENIYLNGAILGMTRAEVRSKFDEIVAFSEVEKFLDTPVKQYSSGMYMRLAFAVAAYLDPEILVVDEVLAVGDAEFQRKCLGRMKDVAGEGRTVLFVSHNMAAVRELCTSAVLMSNGSASAGLTVGQAIDQYFHVAARTELTFATGPLRRVAIRQVGSSITVTAVWQTASPIRVPNLGFVISDTTGSPIVGSNPIVCDAIDPASELQSAGEVEATLTEPRLLDGTYGVSIWFGDGQQDFVHLPNCMRFDVHGMAGTRQMPASTVGPVFPRCTWRFSEMS